MKAILSQAQLKKLAKHNESMNLVSSVLGDRKRSSTALDVDLERQLQGWRENPSWIDQPPEIKVRKSEVGKMSLPFSLHEQRYFL